MNLEGLLLGLHVLGVAAWVGGMAFALLILRPSLSVLEPPQRLLVHGEVFRRFFRLVWHVIPIVLLSGYLLLFVYRGGFAGAAWNVHVMHLTGLAMTAVFVAIVVGPWQAFRAASNAVERIAEAARIRRLVMVNLVLGALTIVVAALNPS